MAYIWVYTTIDAIARRLPRLSIEGVLNSPDREKNAYGTKVIGVETVEQVAAQQEAWVTLVFGMIYEIPLKLTHPLTRSTLANICELLISAQIKQIYMEDDPTPGLGTAGGAGSSGEMQQAMNLLQMYTAGHNVYIPGLSPPQNTPGLDSPQPVYLPEEIVRVRVPDTLTRRETRLGTVKWRGNNEKSIKTTTLGDLFN